MAAAAAEEGLVRMPVANNVPAAAAEEMDVNSLRVVG